MKNTLLGFLILLSLHVSAQVPTDPVLRVDYNLRLNGSKGLTDQNYTLAEKTKLATLTPVPSWLPANNPGFQTEAQVNALIQQAGTGSGVSSYLQLTDKPNFSTVAISGSYADLLGKPSTFAPSAHSHAAGDITLDATHRFVTDTQIATWNSSTGSGFSGLYTDLVGRPTLSPVATSGLYADLSGKPTISTVGVSGLWGDIINKPSFSAVASTGNYSDLLGKPTIPTVPTAVSAFTNDALYRNTNQVAAQIRDSLALVPGLSVSKFALVGGYIEARPTWGDVSGKPTFSTVATSGSYADLTSKPTTLSGYGITDAYTKAQTSQVVADSASTINYVGATVSKSGRVYTVTIPTGNITTDATITQNSTNPVQSGAVYTSQQTQNTNIANNTSAITANTSSIATLTSQLATANATIADLQATQSTNLARLNAIEQQLAQTSTVASPTITAGTVTSSTAGITVTQASSATSTTVYVSANSAFTSGVFSRSVTASGAVSFTGLSSGTLYYARANSLGSSGPASPYSTTISFTTSASVAAPTSVTISTLATAQDILPSTGYNNGPRFYNFQKGVGATDNAVMNYYLAPGATGSMTFQISPTNSLSGVGTVGVDSSASINTGGGSMRHSMFTTYNGTNHQFNARTRGVYAPNSAINLTVGANVIGRLRIATDTVYTEVSQDGGATYTLRQKQLRYPYGTYNMYPKISLFSTNQGYVDNIVLTGFTQETWTQTPTPTVTVTSLTSTSFQLTASDVSADVYDFDISTSSDFSTGNTWNASSNSSRVLNRSSLTANTTYYYRIKASKLKQLDSPVVTGSVTTNP